MFKFRLIQRSGGHSGSNQIARETEDWRQETGGLPSALWSAAALSRTLATTLARTSATLTGRRPLMIATLLIAGLLAAAVTRSVSGPLACAAES